MAHTDLDGIGAVSADARNRAVRTFVHGLIFDVLVALVAAVSATVGGIEWTRTYWLALGLLLAKTAVQAAISYAARHIAPPPT